MKENKMKQKLEEGKAVHGPFAKITDPATIEIAAYSGFDFVIIDLEHGPHSVQGAQNLVRAAELGGITPVVRVLENSPPHILRALDIGAQGVEVPHVSSRKDAEKAAKAVRYFPRGERGLCRFVRAARYSSISADDYIARANRETMLIIHIEGVEGIENLSDILQVPGIDVVFIGPYDLSQSCGFPGKIRHSAVVREMRKAVTIARQKGVSVGTFVEDCDDAERWQRSGVQYISFSVDVGIYYEACSSIVRKLRGTSV